MFQYIRYLELTKSVLSYKDRFPLTLPAIRRLGKLEFHPKTTLIVSENGKGKSTLL